MRLCDMEHNCRGSCFGRCIHCLDVQGKRCHRLEHCEGHCQFRIPHAMHGLPEARHTCSHMHLPKLSLHFRHTSYTRRTAVTGCLLRRQRFQQPLPNGASNMQSCRSRARRISLAPHATAVPDEVYKSVSENREVTITVATGTQLLQEVRTWGLQCVLLQFSVNDRLQQHITLDEAAGSGAPWDAVPPPLWPARGPHSRLVTASKIMCWL